MRTKDIEIGEEYALSEQTRVNKYTVMRAIVTAAGAPRQTRGYSSTPQTGLAVTYLEPETGEEIKFSKPGDGRSGQRQSVWSWQKVVRPQIVRMTWADYEAEQAEIRIRNAERKEANLREFDRLTKLVDLGNAELGGEYFEVQDPKYGYGTRIQALSSLATEELLQAIVGIRNDT